jgi:hypothetical protein
MKPIVFFIGLAITFPQVAFPQTGTLQLEDSLVLPHVGIFTNVFESWGDKYTSPRASWFYYKPDTTTERLYLATAKHVLYKDSLKHTFEYLLAKDAYGSQNTIGNPSSTVLPYPDSLIDLLLVDNSLAYSIMRYHYAGRGFLDEDIVSKEEAFSLVRGQRVLYVGMQPDSLWVNEKGRFNPAFSVIQTTVVDVPRVPQVVHDSSKNMDIRIELILKGYTRSGLSGSPVMLVQTDSAMKRRLKLLGIVNGRSQVDHHWYTFCTLAYHLKELSATRPKKVGK